MVRNTPAQAYANCAAAAAEYDLLPELQQLQHQTVLLTDAAANTNAYFEGAYLEATEPEEALKDCREFWEIPVEGNVGMDQDPDKPFSGDNILVKGVVWVWRVRSRSNQKTTR